MLKKQVLVFPINIFKHWTCILVVNPHKLRHTSTAPSEGEKCQIIYCDSLFEKQEFLIATVRKYLELYYNEKNGSSL